LKTFFVDFIGAKGVFDLSCFSELALSLSYQEFHTRFTNSAKMDSQQLKSVKKGIKWNQNVGNLPILTSECPGWVCYAEKTVGEEAFPFMSKIKSPQQLCGKIVKTSF
jgi:iron only hydrogenase large subunit-like protein